MKLFIVPGACSLAVNIALREAGVPFGLSRVNLATQQTDDGVDFRSINPKGYVPALQLDGDRVLTENVAILQYVADLKPQAQLAPPPGTFERYRLLEWLTFISTEIHKGFSPLFADAPAQALRDYAFDRLAKRLDYLHGALRLPFVVGEQFTVADAYLFTVLGWASEVGLQLGQWPGLVRYREHIGRRPHVIAALGSER
jgi:glutathione S-transferase